MRVKNRKIVVWSAVLAVLAGCAGPGQPATDSSGQGLSGVTVFVADINGRLVPCVAWDSQNYAGGLSCDWGNR